MTADSDARAVAAFAYELGVLKRLRRAGWWQVGVRDPESVSEHSLRVAQLAALIAADEEADPARASSLGIWHDSQETRICDLPHSARKYLRTRPDNEEITRDQLAGLPRAMAKSILDAVIEYGAAETAEAVAARDADKLECLIQASNTATPVTRTSSPGSTRLADPSVPTPRSESPTQHSRPRPWPGCRTTAPDLNPGRSPEFVEGPVSPELLSSNAGKR